MLEMPQPCTIIVHGLMSGLVLFYSMRNYVNSVLVVLMADEKLIINVSATMEIRR